MTTATKTRTSSASSTPVSPMSSFQKESYRTVDILNNANDSITNLQVHLVDTGDLRLQAITTELLRAQGAIQDARRRITNAKAEVYRHQLPQM